MWLNRYIRVEKYVMSINMPSVYISEKTKEDLGKIIKHVKEETTTLMGLNIELSPSKMVERLVETYMEENGVE